MDWGDWEVKCHVEFNMIILLSSTLQVRIRWPISGIPTVAAIGEHEFVWKNKFIIFYAVQCNRNFRGDASENQKHKTDATGLISLTKSLGSFTQHNAALTWSCCFWALNWCLHAEGKWLLMVL